MLSEGFEARTKGLQARRSTTWATLPLWSILHLSLLSVYVHGVEKMKPKGSPQRRRLSLIHVTRSRLCILNSSPWLFKRSPGEGVPPPFFATLSGRTWS
ncbi:hypothetical protein VNO77_03766 [Canavalia gladiata]|uniref:Uncharacterized protein n=1 Tax=Canavalia gladiata TaxID=3824 RepID=A0AAN9MVX1_CANGL